MPFSVKHDIRLDIVEVTFSGLITGKDLREGATACTSVQKETGVRRFLVDANGWDLGASLIEIYNLPAKQYWNEDFDRRSRIAVILPASATARQGALFYETACQNRGWNAQVLPDRGSAVDWLSQAES